MKIAIIHSGGSVGAWRWLYSLVSKIKEYYKDTEISIFYQKTPGDTQDLFKSLEKLDVSMTLIPPQIIFRKKKLFHVKFLDNIYNKLRKIKKTRSLFYTDFDLSEQVNQHDLLFVTWDYDVEKLNLKVPLFYIQHDFIFSHFFGLHCINVYDKNFYQSGKNLVGHAVKKGATFIASSHYVASELKRVFPEYKKPELVVYGAAINDVDKLPADKCKEILDKYDIHNEYIILPTNNMHHKNMEEMLTAYYYVKQKYPHLKLIIIGYGTEGIYVQCNSPYYCDHIEDDQPYDIKSLGLVSDEELIALIQSAKLLVNVSLCEAACGSGVDAWQLGTPTAISDLPCYQEQVKALGVKTLFFNPKNSEDIAQKVLTLLDHPDLAKKNAAESYKALKTVYTKKDMADGYMKIFQEALKEKRQ